MGEAINLSGEDASKEDDGSEDTREFTAEEIAELGLYAATLDEAQPSPPNPTVEVLERDSGGQPTIWQTFGGSIWGIDHLGRPFKIRDKWG